MSGDSSTGMSGAGCEEWPASASSPIWPVVLISHLSLPTFLWLSNYRIIRHYIPAVLEPGEYNTTSQPACLASDQQTVTPPATSSIELSLPVQTEGSLSVQTDLLQQ